MCYYSVVKRRIIYWLWSSKNKVYGIHSVGRMRRNLLISYTKEVSQSLKKGHFKMTQETTKKGSKLNLEPFFYI